MDRNIYKQGDHQQVVETRAVQMDKKKALRMGFIPFQPDLFGGYPASTDWKRELKNPYGFEYWDPARPGRIRRVLHSPPSATRL